MGRLKGKASCLSVGKESTCNAGDPGLIPGLGRSPGEGNGYPPNILARRIPWTEETGGLQSMELQRIRYDWVAFTFQLIRALLEVGVYRRRKIRDFAFSEVKDLGSHLLAAWWAGEYLYHPAHYITEVHGSAWLGAQWVSLKNSTRQRDWQAKSFVFFSLTCFSQCG